MADTRATLPGSTRERTWLSLRFRQRAVFEPSRTERFLDRSLRRHLLVLLDAGGRLFLHVTRQRDLGLVLRVDEGNDVRLLAVRGHRARRVVECRDLQWLAIEARLVGRVARREARDRVGLADDAAGRLRDLARILLLHLRDDLLLRLVEARGLRRVLHGVGELVADEVVAVRGDLARPVAVAEGEHVLAAVG